MTNIQVATATEVVNSMRFDKHVSAKGRWFVDEDEFADKAIIDGELVWRDGTPHSSVCNLMVQEYSCRLVTPLMNIWDGATMRQLIELMNRLYEAGAVVLSPKCIKVHFARSFSVNKAEIISRKIVQRNKLLYTMLFFPTFMSPLWIPERETCSAELATAIYHSYRQIVDGLYANSGHLHTSKLVNRLLAGIIFDGNNMVPDDVFHDCKVRFDNDSSPDSSK